MSKFSRFFAIAVFAVSFALAANIVDNAAVIKMTAKHVPEAIILKMIATQKTQFDLSPEEMIRLTDAGVSENVISAMVSRAGITPTVTTTTPSTTESAAPTAQVASPQAELGKTKVPAGLDVRLKVVSNLTSESVKEGDSVELEVAQDVCVGDRIVIPQGTKALGQVYEVSSKGRGNMAGTLVVIAKSVELADGTKVLVDGKKSVNGGVSLTSGFKLAYGPFAKGKSAKIPDGAVFMATTLGY